MSRPLSHDGSIKEAGEFGQMCKKNLNTHCIVFQWMCHFVWLDCWVKNSHSIYIACVVFLSKTVSLGSLFMTFFSWNCLDFFFFSLSIYYLLGNCNVLTADQGRGKLDDLHQDPLLVVSLFVVTSCSCNTSPENDTLGVIMSKILRARECILHF